MISQHFSSNVAILIPLEREFYSYSINNYSKIFMKPLYILQITLNCISLGLPIWLKSRPML